MIEVRRLGRQIGAEINGVDVRTMDEATFAKIYQAWLDYNVIAVRGQSLTITEYRTYSERFGSIHPHFIDGTPHPDYPDVTVMGVNKFDPDGKLNHKIYARGAEGFHSDGTYYREPPKATQLYALAVPSRGGDTHFASLYAAYEALPQRLKQRLEGRSGAYVFGGPRHAGSRRSIAMSDEELKAKTVFHPILRTHPETGRKLVYFDPTKILYIEGFEGQENDAMINELNALMVQPQSVYSHKWLKGDILVWDNRCSLHKAGGDYPPEEDRIHWRVNINETASSLRPAQGLGDRHPEAPPIG